MVPSGLQILTRTFVPSSTRVRMIRSSAARSVPASMRSVSTGSTMPREISAADSRAVRIAARSPIRCCRYTAATASTTIAPRLVSMNRKTALGTEGGLEARRENASGCRAGREYAERPGSSCVTLSYFRGAGWGQRRRSSGTARVDTNVHIAIDTCSAQPWRLRPSTLNGAEQQVATRRGRARL